MPDPRYGSLWSRDELILALYLYCQIPFSQTRSRNPEVIRLAQLLGRTPSSVARKLGNFGAFDPILAARGVTGLTHFGKADQQIWNEFNGHWDQLVEASRDLLGENIVAVGEEAEDTRIITPPIILPIGPTSQERIVLTRLTQSFFRRSVLSNYLSSCCFCGLDLPPLLVASHIVPWFTREETRTDPQNGLCLCTLHDKAFDRGLMSVTAEFEIAVSRKVAKSRSAFVESALKTFDGQPISLPSRFAPKADYLQWHLKNVYQG